MGLEHKILSKIKLLKQKKKKSTKQWKKTKHDNLLYMVLTLIFDNILLGLQWLKEQVYCASITLSLKTYDACDLI